MTLLLLASLTAAFTTAYILKRWGFTIYMKMFFKFDVGLDEDRLW